MSNIGQIVAALAGGAVLAIAVMLVLKQVHLERQVERQRKIDTATSIILAGVEVFRSDWPPQSSDQEAGLAAGVEVYAKDHLRLIATRSAARSTSGRSGPPTAEGSARSRPRSRSPRR